jgi:hypothetical protein
MGEVVRDEDDLRVLGEVQRRAQLRAIRVEVRNLSVRRIALDDQVADRRHDP